ncbi:hypothetical protein [Micromonospora globispora]|uniref:hypothetical protein n=1 Tax=Micromonospora globispora TaxID=1450148 RepID=UPI000F4E9757|nr:hypothetical protein [Micromonospora globispora]
MNRTLPAILLACALLLAGCTDEKPAASRPSPDQYSRSGCRGVAYEVERNSHFWAGSATAGTRASGSSDPDVRAAGLELAKVAKEAGELDVSSHGKADMTQAEARIAEAQQKLMTACRGLLGEPPWS